jgi:hypothetical protein
MWNIYTSGHSHSMTVCSALAEGSGLPLLKVVGLQPGGMITYGALRGLEKLLDQARAERRDWAYLDNGYFRPSNHAAGEYNGYYRMTRNAYQHDGSGNASLARWQKLNKHFAQWRKGGAEIIVCPPSRLYASLRGFNDVTWLADTLAVLRRHTKRTIVVRDKKISGGGASLWDALRHAHALVTYNSNAAVEAICAGVPVFCTDPGAAAYRMGESDLTRIDSPRYPDDREQWAANLAANQWTLAEMRNGTAWREFNREG